MKMRFKSELSRDSIRMNALLTSQAIIEFTPEGVILDANDNFLNAIGYSREEIVGKHHSMFVLPSEKNSAEYSAFWAALKAGKFQSAEYRRIGKNGRDVWIQASYNPLFDKSGAVIGVMKLASDITETKAISADHAGQIDALNRSQAVIHFAPDGTILDANDNFLKTTGYSLTEIKGRHHSMFVHQDDRGATYDDFWKALQRGEYQAAQYRRVGKGGREFYINATYNPILDVDGKVSKVVKFATDETNRVKRMQAMKQLASQSSRATEDITEQIQSVQDATKAAVEAIRAIEDVIQQVNEVSMSISGTVEEQASVTRNISDNMSGASSEVGRISRGFEEIVSATDEIRASTNAVKASSSALTG